jgi:hypothetical protein
MFLRDQYTSQGTTSGVHIISAQFGTCVYKDISTWNQKPGKLVARLEPDLDKAAQIVAGVR